MEFTKEQERAARRAKKALKELTNSGLLLIANAGGSLYAVDHDTYDNIENQELDDSNSLDCGYLHDMGDW